MHLEERDATFGVSFFLKAKNFSDLCCNYDIIENQANAFGNLLPYFFCKQINSIIGGIKYEQLLGRLSWCRITIVRRGI